MTSDSILQMTCELTNMYKTFADKHLLACDALPPYVTVFLLMQQKLFCAFVLPKLDCCNYLLYGSPMYMLERPKKVQNSAVRLIFKCCKQDHISPILKSLH